MFCLPFFFVCWSMCSFFFLVLDLCSEEGICSASLKRNLYCFFSPVALVYVAERTTVKEGEREITFLLRWIGIVKAFFTWSVYFCRMFTNSNRCFAELSRDLGIHSVDSSSVFHGDVFVSTGRAEKRWDQVAEGGRRAAGRLWRWCCCLRSAARLKAAQRWCWAGSHGAEMDGHGEYTRVFPLETGLLPRFIGTGRTAEVWPINLQRMLL